MAASDNPFNGLSVGQIQELQTTYLAVMTDIAKGGQSYTLGRTFTRAHIAEVRTTLSELAIALKIANGTGKTHAQARIYQP